MQKTQQTKVLLSSSLIFGAFLLTGAGCSFFKNTQPAENSGAMIQEQKMMAPKNGGVMVDDSKNESMPEKKMEGDKAMIEKNRDEKKDVMMQKGSYENYDAAKLALASTGDVVLFFHAPWCPTCRALNSDIEGNLSTIPVGVTILKTDYDSSSDLKKKYGVTYQHTFVQVDAKGNMIKKWSCGNTLASVLTQIQ